MNYKLKTQKLELITTSGQSLFEVIFAIGIVAIILTGVVALATTSIKNATLSRNKSYSIRYLQEGMEWVRSEKDRDWDAFVALAGAGTYCIDNLTWVGCGAGTNDFSRRVQMQSFDTNGDTVVDYVLVQGYVIWIDSQGQRITRIATRYYKWR